MRTTPFTCAIMIVTLGLAVSAQRPALTELDKADAINQGTRLKGKLAGLHLADSGQTWANAFASLDANAYNDPNTNTGFSLRIYTPKAWLMQLASFAAKEYRPFTLADITDDMLEPVLRVTVYPDKPSYVTASGLRNTSSVQHVVLRDLSKRIVVQPISKEPFEETAANAVGGRATFQGINAKFPLDGLREIRGPGGNAEFSVIVIGTEGTKEREFRVKEKHFDRLP